VRPTTPHPSPSNKPRNPYHRHIHAMLCEDIDSAPSQSSPLTKSKLDQYHDLVIHDLRSHDPAEAPVCVLCRTESHRFKACPLLNNDSFLRGFAICMCTTMSK
jgi:hypothetical protein